MFRKLSTYVLFLLLGAPLAAFAQGTGTLAGRVTDDSGEGLPGANVIIGETQLGAATDLDGNYRIIGIPVGEYDVTARFVGFEEETVQGVRISSGYTTQQDFALRDDAIELEGVEVVYERPIIQRDAIGAPRVVSGEEIQNLPVRSVAAVVALQSGSVVGSDGGLNLRGGRSEEVAYYVDGVKVTGSLAVNQNSIQEQEMLIGTIPAKYGDVQSGVISITTKTGRSDFFGSAEGVTSTGLDAYGYNLATLALGGPIVPGRVGFFASGEYRHSEDASPYGRSIYELPQEDFDALQLRPQVLEYQNEAGDVAWVPIPVDLFDNVTDGLDPAALEAAIDSLGLAPEGYALVDESPVVAAQTYTADRFSLVRGKDDPAQGFTFNGNLNFDILPTVSLRLGGAFDTNDGRNYSFTNGLYNRNFSEFSNETWRVYGTLRQRIGDNAFYQITGEFQDNSGVTHPEAFSDDINEVINYGDASNAYNATARRYVQLGRCVDTNEDGAVTTADDIVYCRQYANDGSTRPDFVAPGTFGLPGQISTGFSQSHNQQYRFAASATTQLGVHQLEFGGEYQQNTNRFFSIAGNGLAAFVADEDGPRLTAAGLPEGGITSYDQLTFESVRTRVNYYGYNYLGTEEVDDQSIDGYFAADNTTGQRGNSNIAPWQPYYYAGYIQDKIEYRDLVVNLGLRVDAYNNNAPVLIDLWATEPVVRAGSIEGRPAGIDSDYAVYFNDDVVVGYRDLNGNFYDANGEESSVAAIEALSGQQRVVEGADRSEAFTDYETQVTVMPRVGVSFPVTDQALFFASYNVIAQRPTEALFTAFRSYDDDLTPQDRINNPSLKPEKTTQYELGFRQRVGERAAVTLSGFYRTQENKIAVRTLDGANVEYSTYLNRDFTTSQGVEFGFDLRRTNNLAVSANYTLSFAKGTGSDANTTAAIAWRGTTYPSFISQSDFDQRHTANINVDYRYGDGEGPMIGGMHLLENFGINIIGQFASGQRYTPLAATGFGVFDSFTENTRGQVNSATLPATSRIDVRLNRGFNLGFGGARLNAYLWIQNLLDTENVFAVYRATGLVDYDGYLDTDGGRSLLNSSRASEGVAFNYNSYVGGPINNGGFQTSGGAFYGAPRRIRLGLLLDF